MSEAQGYAFKFDGHGVFTPDGRAEIDDVDTHNREQERKELDWLRTGPEKLFLYVKHPSRDKYERPGNAHWSDPEYRYSIITWLGTPVSTSCAVGSRVNVGFGFHTYRRSLDCVIFGVRYVGWYMESSGNYCRLRKAKVQ